MIPDIAPAAAAPALIACSSSPVRRASCIARGAELTGVLPSISERNVLIL